MEIVCGFDEASALAPGAEQTFWCFLFFSLGLFTVTVFNHFYIEDGYVYVNIVNTICNL